MKKYQWNDSGLQKKAQLYYRISLVIAIIALGVFFVLKESAIIVLAILLMGLIVCFFLADRVLKKDRQIEKNK